ncbi:hypothetical protein COV42_02620 [Candidatus Campbellbacteria bacterium CG11_big_fil_rev_8_21_14_0_20_44_21]|uniref:Uncharacterized protein n=1 Tax=Candidatus Campbellbacteria bacterium CG22_combo_CG10-13_8_21_14_all_43_18 TaxID=1974530 RepID=A0A2H0DX10_9BACT|nr:MAG: hypothetical protein COW82_00695 [Candidatus Campbellbacteria bacterium CG22_combo_CG10-13_8_21_14_all_43_18]PIR24114.1 MAG: hypothetical protein COV42_02620 [Candidatus Campbellbacteria bacterium CG11_big_fil_rev_8_21_14_0_20_44_21]
MSRLAKSYVCEKCGQQSDVGGIQETFDAIEVGLKDIENWPNNLIYMVSPLFEKWVTEHHRICDGEIKPKAE